MLVAAQLLLQAVTLSLLGRIAFVDFKIQKITNRNVLALGALGVGMLVLRALWKLDQSQTGVWWEVWGALIVAAIMFGALLPFWLLRKLGAGDVKLMSVSPLVAGMDGMMSFALLLFVFSMLTALAVKNPTLLPAPLFRQYLEHFERKGIVPFGVPIAAALIGTILLRVFVSAS